MVKYGEGIFALLRNVSPRNILKEPSLAIPFIHVTAPALFLDIISRVVMLGSRKAADTSAWVLVAFHCAKRGLCALSKLPGSATDCVYEVGWPQASCVVCVAPPDEEK